MKKLNTIETQMIGAGALDMLSWLAIGGLSLWNVVQQQYIQNLYMQNITLNDMISTLQELDINTATLVLLHEEQLSHLPGFDEATETVLSA